MNKEKFLNKYAPDYKHIVSTYENCKIYLDFVDDDNFALPDNLNDLKFVLENYFCDYFQEYLLHNLYEYSDVPKCIYEAYTGPKYILVSRTALFINIKLFKEYMLECFREYNITYKELSIDLYKFLTDINKCHPYKIVLK